MKIQKFISLTVKVIVPVVLVQVVVMVVVGIYYSNRFATEVDSRIRNAVETPGRLINNGLLNFEAFNKKETMMQIVGKDLNEAMIVGFDKNVYYSMSPSDIGKNAEDLGRPISFEGFDLSGASGSSFIVDEDGEYIAHISPIYSVAGKSAFLFAYIKVGTEESTSQKLLLNILFIAGSFVAALVSSGACFFILRNVFLTKVQKLKSTVDMVGRGNLGEEAVAGLPQTNDELGVLSTGLGEMINEVRKSRAGLEEEVAKRTQELRESQAELVSKIGELNTLNDELGRMNKLMTGRELKMIELKERVTELEKQLGLKV